MSNKTKQSFLAVFFITLCAFLYAFDKPMISGIKAAPAKGQKINILWTLPENTEKPVSSLLIYRSTKPVSKTEDLISCKLLASLDCSTTGFTDTVSDFKDYYYAVIVVTDKPYELIMPSINATVNGARIEGKKKKAAKKIDKTEEKLYPNGTLRETPLPYLDLVEGLEPTENHISDEARKKAVTLGIPLNKEGELLSPYFFEQDMISPERGDAYLLFDILSRYFAPRKYDQSVIQLSKLTARNIEKEIEERALFYLGEAYYFTGDYENAVKTFVKIQEIFPVQSQKWLEASLDLMSK
ncbi:MAG: hypothetical protein HUK25_09315 [Treponema sp.]|nr:hypothetical protein [Treponema sp.]